MSRKHHPLVGRVLVAGALVGALGAFGATDALAQQTPPGSQQRPQPAPGQRPGGGMRGPVGADSLVLGDVTGFESIFDGTLKNWDGDPTFWRVENNTIIGETTPEKPLKVNTFLVWRGGQPGDFELKLEYKMNSTNSGVQFRSKEMPEVGKWVLAGYQADMDFVNQWTGQIYEERGRGFLALRGQAVEVPNEGKARVIGSLGSNTDLKGVVKINDWNQVHLIARGNVLIEILNGRVTSMLVDDDVKNRAMQGLIGLQIHVGQPMKLEVRNVYLKRL